MRILFDRENIQSQQELFTKNRQRQNSNSVPRAEREEIVTELFNQREYITRRDVEEVLGVSQATAILVLREMTKKGLLQKKGGSKYLKYIRGHRP